MFTAGLLQPFKMRGREQGYVTKIEAEGIPYLIQIDATHMSMELLAPFSKIEDEKAPPRQSRQLQLFSLRGLKSRNCRGPVSQESKLREQRASEESRESQLSQPGILEIKIMGAASKRHTSTTVEEGTRGVMLPARPFRREAWYINRKRPNTTHRYLYGAAKHRTRNFDFQDRGLRQSRGRFLMFDFRGTVRAIPCSRHRPRVNRIGCARPRSNLNALHFVERDLIAGTMIELRWCADFPAQRREDSTCRP